MKTSKAIILNIISVWLCLCFAGCKTSHTVSRAEMHRENHTTVVRDTTKSVTNVTDTTVTDRTITDSMVVTHWIETVITNTVDTAGNIIGTQKETNRTTDRDHYRNENKQQNTTHREATEETNSRNILDILARIDSISNEEVSKTHNATIVETVSFVERVIDIIGAILFMWVLGFLGVQWYNYLNKTKK